MNRPGLSWPHLEQNTTTAPPAQSTDVTGEMPCGDVTGKTPCGWTRMQTSTTGHTSLHIPLLQMRGPGAHLLCGRQDSQNCHPGAHVRLAWLHGWVLLRILPSLVVAPTVCTPCLQLACAVFSWVHQLVLRPNFAPMHGSHESCGQRASPPVRCQSSDPMHDSRCDHRRSSIMADG
jgi:hypothetical protein